MGFPDAKLPLEVLLVIKILIVEDEPPILRDIANLVEGIAGSFCISGLAYNAQSAMELIKKETPDVIVTDINMPVTNGLELIEWIIKNKYDIIPIILSGFNEFEYAKKAMSMGVHHYLLKPVDTGELKEILANVEKDVINRKNALRSQFYSNILEQNNANVQYDHPGNEISVIMAFCLGSMPNNAIGYDPVRRRLWEKLNLENILNAELEKDENVWLFDGRNPAVKIAIFTFKQKDYKRIDCINAHVTETLSNNEYSITAVVSDYIYEIGNISEVVNKALSTLNKRIVIGFFQIIKMYAPNRESNYAFDTLIGANEYNTLFTYIKQGKISLFKEELKRLFKKWEALKCPQVHVEKALRELLSMIEKLSNGKTGAYYIDVEFEMAEAIANALNYRILFESIWYIFENYLEYKNQGFKKTDRHEYMIQRIEEYIIKNFSTSLNNQVLSEKFGLVPSYLSKLFREFKGMSPTDYIINLRVERAKTILVEHPELLSKDVSVLVGYEDPYYFSKIFKKITGVAPSEYRDSARKTPEPF